MEYGTAKKHGRESLGKASFFIVVVLYYNLKIARHPDKWKTLKLVSWNY